jgi:hypothetical protein
MSGSTALSQVASLIAGGRTISADASQLAAAFSPATFPTAVPAIEAQNAIDSGEVINLYSQELGLIGSAIALYQANLPGVEAPASLQNTGGAPIQSTIPNAIAQLQNIQTAIPNDIAADKADAVGDGYDPQQASDQINMFISQLNYVNSILPVYSAAAVPVIAAPATAIVGVSKSDPIGGVSTSTGPTTTGDTFTLSLTDSNGMLSATGTGVSDSDTTNLTISGTLDEVNADLATLTDNDGTVGSDTIAVSAEDDTNGAHATPALITVTVNSLPY